MNLSEIKLSVGSEKKLKLKSSELCQVHVHAVIGKYVRTGGFIQQAGNPWRAVFKLSHQSPSLLNVCFACLYQIQLPSLRSSFSCLFFSFFGFR